MIEKAISVKGVNIPRTALGLRKMNKLVSCAEELFNKVSFFETSITDICKLAGTAVGTFYIYFESKTDVYRYLVERYKREIKKRLNTSILGLTSRYEMERAGIKCFIKYAVENPQVYKIIWGSLAIEEQMFVDYYVSFAESYARALALSSDELKIDDLNSLAYLLMGITNFVGLKAIFEKSSEEDIDKFVDNTVMPLLKEGMFK